jgi:hypothetical protein
MEFLVCGRAYDVEEVKKFPLIRHLIEEKTYFINNIDAEAFDLLINKVYDVDVKKKIRITALANYLLYDVENLFLDFRNKTEEELKLIAKIVFNDV